MSMSDIDNPLPFITFMRGKIEFQTLSQSLIDTAKLRINASVRVG
jgi:hypothetical protein